MDGRCFELVVSVCFSLSLLFHCTANSCLDVEVCPCVSPLTSPIFRLGNREALDFDDEQQSFAESTFRFRLSVSSLSSLPASDFLAAPSLHASEVFGNKLHKSRLRARIWLAFTIISLNFRFFALTPLLFPLDFLACYIRDQLGFLPQRYQRTEAATRCFLVLLLPFFSITLTSWFSFNRYELT